MKERIEKKIGCSIEQLIKERAAIYKKYKGMEVDYSLDRMKDLDYEEIRFIQQYGAEHNLNELFV